MRKWMSMSSLVLVAVTAAGCAEASGGAGRTGRFYGEAVAVGEGDARTYVSLENGRVMEVGIALSERALSGLQSGAAHAGHGADHPMHYEFELPLPAQHGTVFGHAVLDWNPNGHEPPGLYDSPHFDFHFYMIDPATRRAIHPSDPRFAQKAARTPPAEYVPAGYILPEPVGVPLMGTHWVDPTSEELNGKPFAKTLIHGTWDGRLTFIEPMITTAYLETKPDFTAPIPMAEKYREPGYYPSSYSIRWDAAARVWRISLGGFEYRGS